MKPCLQTPASHVCRAQFVIASFYKVCIDVAIHADDFDQKTYRGHAVGVEPTCLLAFSPWMSCLECCFCYQWITALVTDSSSDVSSRPCDGQDAPGGLGGIGGGWGGLGGRGGGGDGRGGGGGGLGLGGGGLAGMRHLMQIKSKHVRLSERHQPW